MNRKINRDYNESISTPSISKEFAHERSNFISPETALKLSAPGELATPQSRLIALILDALIFGLGFGVVWVIWFINLADKGTTPGHHLMGQVVVDAESGESFGWKKMVVREVLIKGLLHWILGGFLFMINYIIDGAFIFGKSQRTLHDVAVGSQVIQRSSKTIIGKLKADEVDTWLNK